MRDETQLRIPLEYPTMPTLQGVMPGITGKDIQHHVTADGKYAGSYGRYDNAVRVARAFEQAGYRAQVSSWIPAARLGVK